MPASAKTSALIWLGIPALVIAVVVGGSGLVWEARTITRLQGQIASLAQENGRLLRRIDDLSHPQPAAAPEARSTPVVRPEPVPDEATAEALSAARQQVERLHDSLAQSSAEITRLHAKAADLESRLASAADDNRRLNSAVDDSRKRLEEQDQATQAMQATLKDNAARLADLESLNVRLKQESSAATTTSAQTRQTVSDLLGIFRRRQMYLNNILRRYREITEQYRAMAGIREGREPQPKPADATELSRIQNSIALAEEDLKQISALSIQAERLQKKLPAK